MKRRRGFTWARFVFWSALFLLNCLYLGDHLGHPDWWVAFYLVAVIVSGGAAKEAWTNLEDA